LFSAFKNNLRLWPRNLALVSGGRISSLNEAINIIIMKNSVNSLIIGLALLAGVHQATAQEARFFRISGPAPRAVIAINPDGTLVWSNALAGTTYTVQTITSLSGVPCSP
jgi:hypothetical protein